MTGAARLGLVLAALSAALVPLHGAIAQSAPTPTPVDQLPGVTVRATPTPDKADVIANRMPRVARCLSPDQFSRDPTGAFNQAYYEELTGEAGYYETIRKPPPNRRRVYPAALHPGERMFANLSGTSMPGISAAGITRPPRPFDYPACMDRSAMEKSTLFARAMALYDKGDYAPALEALIEVHPTLRASPMAGEVAVMIAEFYLKGEGTEKDAAKAVVWLEKAARTPGGDRLKPRYDPLDPNRYYHVVSEAAMKLAGLYMTGNGVEKDPALARRWIETAAHANHIPARKILADMLYAGFGGRQNQRDARISYEYAGTLRHAAAEFSAAEMYDLGEGGRADRKRAVALYGRAAQLGEARAAYALAVAFDKGDGVRADPDMALSLYKVAAVEGVAPAQTAIGTYFYEGGSALGRDLAQARAWFGEAALQGEPDAMVNLAAMLLKGEGGEADPVRAWAWLTLARKGGREDAAVALAAVERAMSAADLAAARALVAG